jgi:hypothetical protein
MSVGDAMFLSGVLLVLWVSMPQPRTGGTGSELRSGLSRPQLRCFFGCGVVSGPNPRSKSVLSRRLNSKVFPLQQQNLTSCSQREHRKTAPTKSSGSFLQIRAQHNLSFRLFNEAGQAPSAPK